MRLCINRDEVREFIRIVQSELNKGPEGVTMTFTLPRSNAEQVVRDHEQWPEREIQLIFSSGFKGNPT